MRGNKTGFGVLSLLVMALMIGSIALADTASAQSVSIEEATTTKGEKLTGQEFKIPVIPDVEFDWIIAENQDIEVTVGYQGLSSPQTIKIVDEDEVPFLPDNDDDLASTTVTDSDGEVTVRVPYEDMADAVFDESTAPIEVQAKLVGENTESDVSTLKVSDVNSLAGPSATVYIDTDTLPSVAPGETATVDFYGWSSEPSVSAELVTGGSVVDTQAVGTDSENFFTGTVEFTPSDYSSSQRGTTDEFANIVVRPEEGDGPESNQRSVRVERELPGFDVSIDNTGSPVATGDDLSVTATVTNEKSQSDDQTLTLQEGSGPFSVFSSEDSTDLQLDPGESKTVTLTWETEGIFGTPVPPGEYEISVLSDDDTATTNVTILESDQPYFNVSIDDTNSPVSEGDTLSVTATVKNGGTEPDQQSISLEIGAPLIPMPDFTNVQLDPGESKNVTLTWDTDSGDAGDYTAAVVSSDDTDSVDVTVQDNPLPTASFTFSPSSPSTSDTVSFDASGSDGNIQGYSWDFGDGSTATGQTASHSYSNSGTFTVELTVTDDEGETDTTTQAVPVGSPPNQPPTASFTFSPNNPDVGETINFDASSSNDPDGTIQSYSWDFGDDSNDDGGVDPPPVPGSSSLSTSTGEQTTHSYSSQGTYDVTLTVTDDEEATSTTTQTVTVGSPGDAAVSSSDGVVESQGETGESAITVDADDGVSIANVGVSIDTSVAEIQNVQAGADVDSSDPAVTFDVVDRTADSVRIEYTNIGADDASVTDFEVAVIEFEAQTDDGETTIQLNEDGVFDGNTDEYTVGVDEGTLTVGGESMPPLPGFSNPPTNTGELDSNLYEDLNGDGDGTDPSEAVLLWSELVQNPDEFNDLTQEQVDKLDWNGDGSLTPADAVLLWSEKVQA